MYALLDSNNFFVACERLFRPDLEGVATVVLSSNDGCAVSRSSEAKALGIAMGEPLHKLRERFTLQVQEQKMEKGKRRANHLRSSFSALDSTAQQGSRPPLAVFSANFELYGDISERIATLLCSITPQIELYSIDEAFLDLSELGIADYAAWGHAVRAQTLRDIGIPVSVGIAPTKTLCKLANHWAKQHLNTGGVQVLETRDMEHELRKIPPHLPSSFRHSRPQSRPRVNSSGNPIPSSTVSIEANSALGPYSVLLSSTPVNELWGIGWRLAPKLNADGVYSALDLARMRPQRAQQLMGVQGRRMVMELCGTPCLPLNTENPPQHMIARGRQFGRDARDLATLSAAVTTLAARACTELRREKQRAYAASIYLSTNRHKPNYHSAYLTVPFTAPTSDTGGICQALIERLSSADEDLGYSYHKAEVILHRLTTSQTTQTDLFHEVDLDAIHRSDRRMHALDHIRAKHGPGALMYASESLSDVWKPRRGMSSPRYTSSWSDLPEARIMPL